MEWLIGTLRLSKDPVPQGQNLTRLGMEESTLRLFIATYLLGEMIDTPVNANGADAKDIKVKAAFDYADKLLKF